jgi:hypothetical protein
MEIYLYFPVALLGMLSHFLKKKIKGESITEIKSYFGDNVKSTALAFISTIIGFVLLVQLGDVSFVSSFGVGFMFDSVFNKWDNGKGK